MKAITLVSVLSALLALAGTANAETPRVQELPYLEQRLHAPARAFELSIATGYAHALGMLRPGVGMTTVAPGGVGLDLAAGYRVDPSWAVSLGGSFQEFLAHRAGGARTLAQTFAVQYHVDPDERLDPWVELGTGYRMFWEMGATGPSVLTHGFELARVRAGLDIRSSETVALAPVVGLDATLFLWQAGAGGADSGRATASTFLFAGVQGRFDVGGISVPPRVRAATQRGTAVAR